MSNRITPRNGLVLIKPIPATEQKTASGIVLPKARGDEFEVAEIILAGRGVYENGTYTRTDDLKPGMLVLCRSKSSSPVGTAERFVALGDGINNSRLIDQSDIFAIIERPAMQDVPETGQDNAVVGTIKPREPFVPVVRNPL